MKYYQAVEALQYTGANQEEVFKFCQKAHLDEVKPDEKAILIPHAVAGSYYAKPGDWILETADGEFSVCRDERFKRTYERV